MKSSRLIRTIRILSWSLLVFSATPFASASEDILSATEILSSPFVNAWESFSYPLDIYVNPPYSAGDSIHGGTGGVNSSDANGEGGWTSPWILEATSYEAELSETQIDTNRILHQDSFQYPGSFSLEIKTPAINGPKRFFPEITSGELWISFVYRDTGPVEDHDSGLFVLDSAGKKLFLLGKPRNAGFLGISHLPVGATDQLTTVAYDSPHQLVARIVLDNQPGQNDAVYLWIDPNENDRLDTYDTGGENLANVDSIAAIMLSRRQDAGSGFFDDLSVSTMPSLAPAGSVRIDLGFDPNSPFRSNADIVLHDVISTDLYLDSRQGDGYGHNKDQNYFMVVRGSIYFNDQGASRVARGIPIDRLSGLSGFAIAPFNESLYDSDSFSGGKNALRFHPDNGTIQAVPLSFPQGNYSQCRVLTSGDGFGLLPAVFEYSDGTTQEASLQSPDWLDDPVNDGHGGVIPADIPQINNGMNRLDAISFFEGSTPNTGGDSQLDDASFFLNRIVLDKTKALSGIKIGPSASSVINVYDIILDVENGATPVTDWMMY